MSKKIMIVNIAAKMEEEIVDINAKYERIFGSTPKPLLFDEDEYALLRKEIEESEYIEPRNIFEWIPKHKTRYSDLQSLRKNLPFEGIALTPYASILLEKNIKLYQNSRNLFCVEKREGNSIIARAVAYYTPDRDCFFNMQCFFVLEGSFFKENSYSKELLNKELLKKSEFFNLDGTYFYQNTKLSYESPSAVASLFLGEPSTLQTWVNKEGKTLDKVYPCFGNSKEKDDEEDQENILTNVTGRIKNNLLKNHKKVSPAQSLPPADPKIKNNLLKNHKKDSPHLFYIKLENGEAQGYFNSEDGYFYICEGSIVSNIAEVDVRRKNFLNNSCKKFRTIKSTQCISASEAAYYVTGRVSAKHTVWRDENGRYLTNYYPKEQITKADKIEQDWSKHIFFINVGELKGGPLLASGIFNPDDKTFTLISGSWLSKEERTLLFKYGVYGRYRASIINGECSSYENGYLLKKNHKCPNCTLAAAAVLGAELDGTLAWKDKDGVGLGTWAQRKGVKL